ncbi:MAG: hypothetical protein HQ568_12470, partial [Calditrichaeota bacterium]|nr:hypothetical protein [Calditrichota bacterium]
AMAVLRKDLIPGRTWAGGFIDAVNRKLDEDYLDQYYRKNAYVGGLDFYHRWSNMQWETSGVINFSHLDGSSEVITHVQQESQRYFQHPDADYIELDTTLTELNGYQGELTIAKESGENFIISATYTETSPGYTVNDLGFMNRADYRSPQAYMEYHDFVPSQYLRWWRTWFGNDNAWSLGGDQIWSHNFIGTKVGLHNFWEVEIEGSGGVKCWDDRATWGGPTIINPSSTGMKVNVDSDPRKKTQVGLDVIFSTDQYGGYSNNYDLSLRMRPLPSLQIILTGGTDVSQNKAHHITHVDDPLAVETYGSRYIFSDLIVHRETISVQADWVFNPEVTLQFFAEPGISSYDFSKYKELVKPRTFDFAEYGKDIGTIVDQGGGLLEIDPDGNGLAPSFHMQDRNFNFRTLKINCVLRWEYRLGSVFYLVWQQQRDSFQPGEGTLDNRDDIDALFNTEPINIVHAKLSYWLSI